ncbi:MAG: tellurite resistance-related uncharacterized protein [Candidatus Azotimanducaceae bacterium]|jgi:tellurite resistance-related uncharacterized protein
MFSLMKSLPKTVAPYKQTPEFDEVTIPKGLLKAHSTKNGVWGKIVILEGELRYQINEPEITHYTLDESCHGVVEPEIKHEVAPLGKVRFYVEFYR